MYQNFMPYINPMYMLNTRNGMLQEREMDLARVYFKSQPFVGIFPVDEAMYKGTVFPNLYAAYPPPIGQFDNRRK
ncbi:hypothetical protein Z968_05900 [Clostridium novyi A str. 4552]|uniref:Spore coat protein CotJA n=1 Tax=Clostridium novyi A str. 4552 TaxID=1444289 RepID=A0A0A0IAD1_CLONO|nr:spore coat associated protein CotJA [Clostridium novyi]KGM96570.1 hypothetical protein Z968_05900 [Clostridium novyi A str. 4552]